MTIFGGRCCKNYNGRWLLVYQQCQGLEDYYRKHSVIVQAQMIYKHKLLLPLSFPYLDTII